MKGSGLRILLRYLVAALTVFLGYWIVRVLSTPGLNAAGGGTSLLVSFFAILLSAWYGGLGPGLFTTGLIVLIIRPPLYPISRLIPVLLFVACGALISALLGAMHAARRRAEATSTELRRSEERLRNLMDSITDHAIFTTDPEGRVTGWSRGAEQVLGYAPGEILGRPTSGFASFDPSHEEPADDEPPGGSSALPATKRAEFPLHCTRSDGTRFWAAAAATPLMGGEAPGLTWVLRDISEARRVQQELQAAKDAAEAANRTKDQFLAALSHELRTPLTPALASVSAILSEPRGLPADLHSDLEVIQRCITLEARLIDDLLDVTRIVRGKMHLARERTDAHRLLRRALEICHHDIEVSRLHLEVDLRAADHHVDADPARLQQVFWNLIKNAVRFTHSPGRIGVRTWNAPGFDSETAAGILVVELSDSGVGIDPEVLPRIFDAFEQGDPAISRQFGGLGLGLAISRGLAEAHGWLLEAASEGKGRGATFTLRLPVEPPLPDGPLRPAARGEPAAAAAALRVLLVEDNAETLRMMTRLLRSRGYHVIPAHSLASALETAGREAFDVVVSDIGLTDGSGLDLMRQILAERPVPGIAVSGFGTEDDLRKSREAGFALHLTKPIDFPTLEGAIRSLAAGSVA
jgi:PAS domain S-box-containing protein